MEAPEILITKDPVRWIANSVYICIPSYLLLCVEIIPEDHVSVTVMSDGKVRITFIKERQK